MIKDNKTMESGVISVAYRVAICDDNASDAAYVRTLLHRWAQEREIPVRSECFPSGESFLFQWAGDQTYDILLLDIEMGAVDGVSLAKKIRQDNQTVQIIFITGYTDYIAEGYEVAALHYLVKPLREEKLFATLDRAYEKLLRNETTLTLTTGGETIRIPLHEIRYLDVCQNYVTVHGKSAYTVKRTLGEFESLLGGEFVRVGRALIVNLNRITRVTRTTVYLSDGTALPLPRGAYERLNRAIISQT